METRFLPAERDSGAQIAQQGKELSAVQLLTQLANVVPDVLMVLNDKRQIVFVNQQLLRLVSCRNPRDVYGARAGEVMRCIHARETDGGCGTTESCRHCGAALATAAALDGKDAVEECRITREEGGEPLNLRVKTTPLDVQGRQYVVLSAADISHEKRREALERVLFGEILE
ncbi:MAG: PAS domain-containing protein, partial [Gemmatimonadota bacterium]